MLFNALVNNQPVGTRSIYAGDLLSYCFREQSLQFKQSLSQAYADLRTGSVMRLLRETDIQAISLHLKGLTAEDRILRFSFDIQDTALDAYAKKINFHRDIVVGAWEGDCLVGLCHFAVFEENGHPAGEVGITVSEGARRRGYGRKLLDAAFAQAAEHGVAVAYICFLRRNKPMGNLVLRLNATVDSDGKESTARIVITPANENCTSHRRLTPTGVEVFEAGPAKASRTVLLVHGAGGDAWQWRRNIQPYLTSVGIKSHALSLSNHGTSKRGDTTIASYLDDIRETINTFGRPDTIVGHSMGGYLVQQILTEMSVDRAVLVGSLPPDGLAESELAYAAAGLGKGYAQEVLTTTMRSQPKAARPMRAKSIAVIGGNRDGVIPAALVKRTSDFHGVKADMVDGGHLLMLGQSWRTVADAVVA